jgi:hypothetical protein
MPQLITRNETQDKIIELDWIGTLWQRPVQRLFWIYDVPDAVQRGAHHHETCRMILQCVVGSVEVYVQTPDEDYHFTLNAKSQYLFLDPQDWRVMHQFSADAVLVVFADKPYKTTIYLQQPYRST